MGFEGSIYKDATETRQIQIVIGIPEKKQYRSEDVATVLGVSTDLLRWRFRRGKYPEVRKDSAGRRMFSLGDIERLAKIRIRRCVARDRGHR